MTFLGRFSKASQRFFVILQVVVDLKMHVICVGQCFQLLEVGDVFLWIFLGLRGNECYKFKVVSRQCHIEKTVGLDQPADKLQGFLASNFNSGWVDVFLHRLGV